MENKKGNKVKAAGVLMMVIVVILILSSKTIYTYNLATVTAVLPFYGTLNKSEHVKGVVNWADIAEIYAEVSGLVTEISVSEGDVVKKGQPIAQLYFDEEDIHQKLKEYDLSLLKLEMDLESIRMKINKTNRYIEDLKSEEYNAEDFSDYEINQLQKDIEKAQEDYEKTERLFDVGGASQEELDKAKDAINNLLDKKANLEKTRTENVQKDEDSIADKEKNRQSKLLDYQNELESYNQDIKAKNIDISNIHLQKESLQRTLNKNQNNLLITAIEDGTIIDLNIKKGQRLNENQLITTIGVGNEYLLECSLSLDNNFVFTGDTYTISNTAHSLTADVKKISLTEQVKNVTLSLTSDEVSVGETFDIYFEKESEEKYILVPNGALNLDSDGYFLYQIKRRDGMLGKEFYASKLRIYIGDNDNDNTVVTNGITFFEPVVKLSDKSFTESETIKLSNEGDFFAE